MSREEPILKEIEFFNEDPKGADITCSSCLKICARESKDAQTGGVNSGSLKSLVKYFQELMTDYKWKFGELKDSEYSDCQVKEVNNEMALLSSSDLQLYLPRLKESYEDFFLKMYEKTKHLIRKLENVKYKSERFAERGSNDSSMSRHRQVSSERPFQTISDSKFTADNEKIRDLTRKIRKLEAKNEDLKKINDDLELDKGTLFDKNNDFKSKIKKLNNDLEDLNEQINSKDEMEEKLQKEIKRLQKKIDNEESERNEHKSKGSINSSELTERNGDFEKVMALIEFTRAKESEEQVKQVKLHEEVKLMREDMKMLRTSGTTVKSSGDKAIQTNDERDTFDRKEAESKKEVLTARVVELEEVVAKKDTAFQNITAKIRSLLDNEKILKPKIEDLEMINTQLKEDNDELKKTIEGIEKRNSKLKEENDEINKTIKGKQKGIETMKLKIKEINNFEKAAEELATCKRQNQQAKIENEKLVSKVESLEMKLKCNVGEFEDIKKERLRLVVEMENMKKLNFKKKTEGDTQA